MAAQPQYILYNDVIVTLFEDYIVSSINTKGYPDPNKDFTKSGPHLVSLTISPPNVGEGSNPEFVGATGTVSLVDYKNILFNKFTKYASDLADKKGDSLLPPIQITVNCYTGSYNFVGLVEEWKLQFNGGAPTYNLSWKSFGRSSKLIDGGIFGKWKSPKKFIQMAEESLSFGQKIKFKFSRNGEEVDINSLDDAIKFNSPEDSDQPGIEFDVTKRPSCGNILLDAYLFLVNNATTSDGIPLVGEIPSDRLDVFEARPNNDKENSHKTENTEICNQLIFVLNGNIPAYKTVKCSDGKTRTVIPMTDFSFNTDSKNIFLQSDVMGNQNGSQNAGTQDGTNQVAGDPSVTKANNDAAAGKNNMGSATTIEFDCYNVMSFDRNNPSSAISFSIYTEYGELHPVSGTATVKEVSYDISGAVVKAHVVATKSYNALSSNAIPLKPIESQDNDISKEGDK